MFEEQGAGWTQEGLELCGGCPRMGEKQAYRIMQKLSWGLGLLREVMPGCCNSFMVKFWTVLRLFLLVISYQVMKQA